MRKTFFRGNLSQIKNLLKFFLSFLLFMGIIFIGIAWFFPDKLGYMIYSRSYPEPLPGTEHFSFQKSYQTSASSVLTYKCGGPFNLCGHIDNTTGDVVIPFQFEESFSFYEGLSPVKINGCWGFINEQGQIIIEPQFDRVGSFYQGLAEVVINDTSGIIDQSGKILMEPRFVRAIPFTRDVVIVQDKEIKNFPYSNGLNIMLTLRDPFFAFLEEKEYRLFSLNSQKLSDKSWVFKIFERRGLGKIWAQDDATKLFGLLRADGSWLVQPEYQAVFEPHDGNIVSMARVSFDKRIIFDTEGQATNNSIPDDLEFYHNGMAIHSKKGRKGLFNESGQLIGGRYYQDARAPSFKGGPGYIQEDDGHWAVVTQNGISISDHEPIATFSSGVRIIGINKKAYVTNVKFSVWLGYLTQCVMHLECEQPLDEISRFEPDQPTPVKRNSNNFYINTDGTLIDDTTFNELNQSKSKATNNTMNHPLQNEFHVDNSRNGGRILDSQERVTLNFGYYPFIEQPAPGIFSATPKGKTRDVWFNAYGENIPEFPENADERKNLLNCTGGYTRIFPDTSSGSIRWGIVGKDGKVIIEPVYRAVGCFRKGVAWVTDDSSQQWCAVGSDGKKKEGYPCVDQIYPIFIGSYYDVSGEKMSDDPYESSVLWVQAFLEYNTSMRQTAPKKYRRSLNRNREYQIVLDDIPYILFQVER